MLYHEQTDCHNYIVTVPLSQSYCHSHIVTSVGVDVFIMALGESWDLTRIGLLASSKPEQLLPLKSWTYTANVTQQLARLIDAHYSAS